MKKRCGFMERMGCALADSLRGTRGYVSAGMISMYELYSAGLLEIDSRLGGTCRIRNPWPADRLDIYRNGLKPMTIP